MKKNILKAFIFTLLALLVYCFVNLLNSYRENMILKDIEYKEYGVLSEPGYKYVIYNQKNQQTSADTVLYYFHGASGDQLSWINTHKNIYQECKKRKVAFPTVIAISFGPKWGFVPEVHSKVCVPLSYFWENIVPEVESKIPFKIKKRIAMGYSMGGFNTVQLFLRDLKFFDKVLLISPAVSKISPYSDEETFQRYVDEKRESISMIKDYVKLKLFNDDSLKRRLLFIPKIQRVFFKDDESWHKSSYEYLIHSNGGKSFPDLYLTCGKDDELGIFISTEDFYKVLIRNGINNVKWSPVEGSHADLELNIPEIVDFIEK